MVSSTPCAPGSSEISRVPRAGSFHSAITGEESYPDGLERCAMPKDVSVMTAEPGSSASTLAYRARPAGGELRAVEQGRRNDGRANGPDDLRHVVVLREVLAHQRDDRDSFADFYDLDRPARYVDGLPPADVRVKRATEGGTGRSGVRRATSDDACPGERETTVQRANSATGPPFSSLEFTPTCI